MKKIFLSILVISSMFLIGCQKTAEVKKDEHAGHSNQNTESKLAATFTAELKTTPTEIKAGEKVEFAFTVKNPKGEKVEKLQIVHEKPMHLLIVSEDLDEFYHEHPAPQADGTLKAPFTFKNGGNYKVYADFTPEGSKQIVQNYDVTVNGNGRAKVELKPDEKLEKTVDDLFVTMKPNGDLLAGKELTIDFNVLDAKTKKPITDLQNYLGELAHFVVISQDLKEFVHAHPMTREEHQPNRKTEHANHSKVKSEATVSAHLAFPKAGLYKVFAQFQRAGKVITVPFVLNVQAGEKKAENATAVEIPKDAYKITASKEGFSPSEIKINKNNFKKLAFVRIDTENCADEVVFKSLNITKKLPLNEVVLIDLPKDFSGELSFACGMNMYQGKAVVE